MRSNLAFRLLVQKQMRLVKSNPTPQRGFTLLGMDYGTKFLGLSITDTDLKRVYMLETIESKGELKTHTNPKALNRVRQIITENNVFGIVYGVIPTRRHFEDDLNQFLQKIDPNLPQTTVDESATTFSSKQILQQLGENNPNASNLKNAKTLKDGLSSMLIMQIFLDYYNNQK